MRDQAAHRVAEVDAIPEVEGVVSTPSSLSPRGCGRWEGFAVATARCRPCAGVMKPMQGRPTDS